MTLIKRQRIAGGRHGAKANSEAGCNQSCGPARQREWRQGDEASNHTVSSPQEPVSKHCGRLRESEVLRNGADVPRELGGEGDGSPLGQIPPITHEHFAAAGEDDGDALKVLLTGAAQLREPRVLKR